VMVDATHEDELTERFPAEYVSGWQAQSRVMSTMHSLARLGILRLMLRAGWLPESLKQHFAKLPPEVRPTYEAFYVDPHTLAALIREMAAVEASYAEACQIGAKPNLLGDIPLAVVKHGRHEGRLPPRASAGLVESYAQAFEAVQAELAQLSSNSQVFAAENSGHSIQIDQPERVIEAIRWVLDHGEGKRMANDE
jgi:hypothetical protein